VNISASSMKRAFWFLLAIIFLIENWLWEHVRDWLATLCRRIGLERFEPWLKTFVASLSPLATLLLFGVPALAILPFKIIAVALIARGKITAGLVSIFLAKTLALGVTSYLFAICRSKLLQIHWFKRFYVLMLTIRAWARDIIAPVKAQLKQYVAMLRTTATSRSGQIMEAFLHKCARLRANVKKKHSS